MQTIRSMVIMTFGLCLAILVSVLVMTKGWGLEPKSWWWIIGGSLFGNLLAQIVIKLGESKD